MPKAAPKAAPKDAALWKLASSAVVFCERDLCECICERATLGTVARVLLPLNATCCRVARARLLPLLPKFRPLFRAPFRFRRTDLIDKIGWNAHLLTMDTEGIAGIARACIGRADVDSLFFKFNGKGDAGCFALVEALRLGESADRGVPTNLPKLTCLDLRSNDIGKSGIVLLAGAIGRGALPMLEWLNCNNNRIGDGGCEALAYAMSGGAISNLRSLCPSHNEIRQPGRKALAGAVGGAQELRWLTLCNNPIGDDGCLALLEAAASGERLQTLEALCLAGCEIGGPGGVALANACREEGILPNVVLLKLEAPPLGEEGRAALAELPQRVRLVYTH